MAAGNLYVIWKIFLLDEENIVLSEIPDKDGIYDSIKEFLGKGK